MREGRRFGMREKLVRLQNRREGLVSLYGTENVLKYSQSICCSCIDEHGIGCASVVWLRSESDP